MITLTTDFGLSDPYVAAVKGVILSINPQTTIVDISHDIRPQRIEQGSFVLAAAWPYFAPGTIHVAVVDPGVGTKRRPIALISTGSLFVGPDNGLLSAALSDAQREAARDGPREIPLPSPIRAFILANDRFHRNPVSATFHGRDIFAPVAAHLSLGVSPEALGPETEEIVALPPLRAVAEADASLLGHVLHVDRYGNLITSIRAEQLSQPSITVTIRGRSVRGLVRTFDDCAELAALIGSTGFVGIALKGGSAAEELGADVGEPVVARPN